MQTNQDSGVLKISGALVISEAEQLRDALFDFSARNSEISVDLSEVTSCDTSALQLLLSLRLTAAQAGKTMHVTAVSDAFREAVSGLGLTLEECAFGQEVPHA